MTMLKLPANIKADIEDIYPLSPMQQGMLFHTVYSQGSGVYVEQLQLNLEGDLKPRLLERAWQEVVDRHAILRTGFVWEGLKQPVQVVSRAARVPFEYLDWSTLSSKEYATQLEEHLSAERRRGFDMNCAPLMRLTLIKQAEDLHALIWNHHHILLDGWCTAIVLNQVQTLYDGYKSGKKIDLGRSRPYRAYIEWLQRQDKEAARAFWRSMLAGFRAPSPL